MYIIHLNYLLLNRANRHLHDKSIKFSYLSICASQQQHLKMLVTEATSVQSWYVPRRTDWVGKGVPNSWGSCMEREITENKISARTCKTFRRIVTVAFLRRVQILLLTYVRGGRWPKKMGRMVRYKKMRELRWDFSMHSLESKRSKLELDAPLNWQQLSSRTVSTEDRCNGSCVTTPTFKLALSFSKARYSLAVYPGRTDGPDVREHFLLPDRRLVRTGL